jgi:tetratricopeptide (TPR) repeat protein
MTGNYIYYKHAKKKILKLKSDQPSFELSLIATSLLKIGGVNRWAAYIPVIIVIAGIWVAIIIPNYHAYKMRSYNAAALADLTNACTAQLAHFVDNATYCDSIERLTGDYYGLYLSEGVTVYVQSANKDHYLMVAFHEKGNKKYVIDGPDGGIRETEKTFTVADFNKAIEINPRDAAAYHNRGLIYGKGGQYDQAISDYTKALEIDPKSADAYNNRGISYYEKGQYEQAISDYTKAIEINSRHAKAYLNRGNAYGHKGQLDQAISDFSKVIDIDPRHAKAYDNLGIAYGHKGQHDKAISDYTKALEIDPKSADAYNNRGISYFFRKEYEKAWDDVHKAQSLGHQVHPGFLNELREASGRER